ncbi:hypothetical protein BD410DRAFT_516009 [Rickenella mellea]|uniref:Uncharacterized protein n=1 Tax=Rickenella mellea TaxID=50990 RepID=A0A4Y7PSU6_9AGAM|nr:hypothetical protein BD410DRAFT_516009 [Rickenella mellea]
MCWHLKSECERRKDRETQECHMLVKRVKICVFYRSIYHFHLGPLSMKRVPVVGACRGSAIDDGPTPLLDPTLCSSRNRPPAMMSAMQRQCKRQSSPQPGVYTAGSIVWQAASSPSAQLFRYGGPRVILPHPQMHRHSHGVPGQLHRRKIPRQLWLIMEASETLVAKTWGIGKAVQCGSHPRPVVLFTTSTSTVTRRLQHNKLLS